MSDAVFQKTRPIAGRCLDCLIKANTRSDVSVLYLPEARLRNMQNPAEHSLWNNPQKTLIQKESQSCGGF